MKNPLNIFKYIFYKNGKPRILRLFITFFIVTSGICVVQKINGSTNYSDEFMRSLFAFVVSLIGADTWRENCKTKNGSSKTDTN